MATSFTVTWEEFCRKAHSVVLVEDPVTSGYLALESFVETYEPLLKTFDGRDMSSFVDFYLHTSPVNKGVLLFVDDDAKMDFLDEAVEMKLIPPMADIQAGEDADKAAERKRKEAAKMAALRQQTKEEQRARQARKNKVPQGDQKRKMLIQAQKSYDQLHRKLESERDPEQRQLLEAKIQKIAKLLLANPHSM
jgi:regulator of protease activity HflC (stomatin/prohibitin superfamily)